MEMSSESWYLMYTWQIMNEFETFFPNFDERNTEKMFNISLKNSERRRKNYKLQLINMVMWILFA